VLRGARHAANEEHDFGTVAVDSVDWLEQIDGPRDRAKHDAKDLAYGKGALKQAEVWQELLAGFNELRNARGMVVILIGHSQIKRFDSPETEPYDRYMPKLQERSNALVREWADAVLFANYRTVVKKTDVGFKKEVARGISDRRAAVYTTEKPAYMAKNRYALPDELLLSWGALETRSPGALSRRTASRLTRPNLKETTWHPSNIFPGGFDANAVAPAENRDFEPLPAGLYDVEITGSESRRPRRHGQRHAT
jgi:hypothetical protein